MKIAWHAHQLSLSDLHHSALLHYRPSAFSVPPSTASIPLPSLMYSTSLSAPPWTPWPMIIILSPLPTPTQTLTHQWYPKPSKSSPTQTSAPHSTPTRTSIPPNAAAAAVGAFPTLHDAAAAGEGEGEGDMAAMACIQSLTPKTCLMRSLEGGWGWVEGGAGWGLGRLGVGMVSTCYSALVSLYHSSHDGGTAGDHVRGASEMSTMKDGMASNKKKGRNAPYWL